MNNSQSIHAGVYKMRYTLKILAFILIAFALTASSGCGKKDEKASQGAPPGGGGGKPGGFGAPLVRVKKAVKEDYPDIIKAVGSLEPNEEVLVSSEVSAKITKIISDEGKHIKIGDTILVLDEEKFTLEVKRKDGEYKKAKSDAEFAKKDYERKKELVKEGLVSTKDYEEARNKLDARRGDADTAQAALDIAKKDFANSRVKAPFSGVVAERYSSVGTYVKPGDKLVKLLSIDPIKVTATIPERHAKSIKTGDEITLSVATLGSEFKGTVYFVSPNIDESTRTFTIKATVKNHSGTLSPGLFANVSIVKGIRKGVFLIPESGLINKSDRSVVFILSGDTVSEKTVTVDERVEGIVIISDGIEEGSDVVVEGASKLSNGAKVTVASPQGGASPSGNPPANNPSGVGQKPEAK